MKKRWNQIRSSRPVSSFLYFLGSAELDITPVAVAYYLLISVFPILMVITSLLPYWRIDINQLMVFLKTIFPARLYPTVQELLVPVFTQASTPWLGVSIFSVLYTFTRAMNALQKAFNKAYGVAKHRGVFLSHVIGILIGLALQVILIFSVTVFTAGDRILHFLSQRGWINQHWTNLLEYRTLPVVFLAMTLALILLYLLLPNVKIRKFRYVLPGTIFVILVMTSVGRIFRFYMERYANRLLDFRLVTAVVMLILVLWFMFIATVLIIGAALNATFQSLEMDCWETRKGEQVPIRKRIEVYLRRNSSSIKDS
ncbi:YihY/virulence factor BrkB family protein [Streptococcus sp. DD13]|uniref:YihY/virulence factor BrkB family protein n=1 Tax=Streptococcus sp. DD13 TaxID=1777881 RepID=UPI00079B1E3C|nr:YihY/virulence factor BrkB family protein [Streptococcus sp. DD13]KXT78465.1 hypothetical protein STRDD13_00768 [Streptococcus sp. DD13]